MRVEWDPKKARSNLQKHGVDFFDAQFVFQDPNSRTVEDVKHEDRLRTIGRVGLRVIVVVHIDRDTETDTDGSSDSDSEQQSGNKEEVVRIISARKATPTERKKYECE